MTGNFWPMAGFAPGAPSSLYVVSADYASLPPASGYDTGTLAYATDYEVPVEATAAGWMPVRPLVCTLNDMPAANDLPDGALVQITDWPPFVGTMLRAIGGIYLPLNSSVTVMAQGEVVGDVTASEQIMCQAFVPGGLLFPLSHIDFNFYPSKTGSTHQSTWRIRVSDTVDVMTGAIVYETTYPSSRGSGWQTGRIQIVDDTLANCQSHLTPTATGSNIAWAADVTIPSVADDLYFVLTVQSGGASDTNIMRYCNMTWGV